MQKTTRDIHVTNAAPHRPIFFSEKLKENEKKSKKKVFFLAARRVAQLAYRALLRFRCLFRVLCLATQSRQPGPCQPGRLIRGGASLRLTIPPGHVYVAASRAVAGRHTQRPAPSPNSGSQSAHTPRSQLSQSPSTTSVSVVPHSPSVMRGRRHDAPSQVRALTDFLVVSAGTRSRG